MALYCKLYLDRYRWWCWPLTDPDSLHVNIKQRPPPFRSLHPSEYLTQHGVLQLLTLFRSFACPHCAHIHTHPLDFMHEYTCDTLGTNAQLRYVAVYLVGACGALSLISCLKVQNSRLISAQLHPLLSLLVRESNPSWHFHQQTGSVTSWRAAHWRAWRLNAEMLLLLTLADLHVMQTSFKISSDNRVVSSQSDKHQTSSCSCACGHSDAWTRVLAQIYDASVQDLLFQRLSGLCL